MRADCRQRKSPLRGGWRLVAGAAKLAAGSAAAAATTGGGEPRAAAKERGGGRSAVRSHLRANLWLLSGWRQHTAYAAHDQHLDQPISIGFSINTCPIFLRRVTANTASMSQQWTYVAVKPRAERKRIRRKPFQSRRTCRERAARSMWNAPSAEPFFSAIQRLARSQRRGCGMPQHAVLMNLHDAPTS